MTQVTFRIDKRKAKIVRQGLQDLAADIPKIGRREVRNTLERILRVMKIYPPERAGQTYVRTFKLKRGWKIQGAGATGYKLINRARFKGRSYVKFVVGDSTGAGQAWMHKGRWPIFANVVDKEVRKLPIEVHRALKLSGRKLKLR